MTGARAPGECQEEDRAEYWRQLLSKENEGPAGVSHVLFRLGTGNFAVEASLCKGVVRKGRVARLPGTPAYFLGVAGIRGDVVSATDPRVLFGLPQSEDQEKGYYLILGAAGLKSALWVDWVDDVIAVDPIRILTGQGAVPRAPEGVILGSWPGCSPPASVLDGRRYLHVTAVRVDRAER